MGGEFNATQPCVKGFLSKGATEAVKPLGSNVVCLCYFVGSSLPTLYPLGSPLSLDRKGGKGEGGREREISEPNFFLVFLEHDH